MQTRRQTDYHNVPIRDLLLNRHKRVVPKKRRNIIQDNIEKEKTEKHEKQEKQEKHEKRVRFNIPSSSPQLRHLRDSPPPPDSPHASHASHISHIPWSTRLELAKQKQQQLDELIHQQRQELFSSTTLDIPHPLTDEVQRVDTATTLVSLATPDHPIYMIIDTESFKFDNKLLPLQIAWCAYMWIESEKELLQMSDISTVYVDEILHDPAFDELPPHCLQKHKTNNAHYPCMTASDVLQQLENFIQKFNINILVGYNISWDFAAIGNLIDRFNPKSTSFDSQCDNPFNPMRLNYIDLMHETVKKYGQQLAAFGIQDGTIHRADDSNRIMLRKNKRYSKSIYSASYVLQSFFGVTQEHLADHDVKHEALLLQKCLTDFGQSSIEYNMCYPQNNCYQRMLHFANELIEDPSSASDDYNPSQILDDDVCLFTSGDSDVDGKPPKVKKDKEEMF